MDSNDDPMEGSSYTLDTIVKVEIQDDVDIKTNMSLLQLVYGSEEIPLNSTDAMFNPKTGQMVCLHCLLNVDREGLLQHMVEEHSYKKLMLKCQICEEVFEERNHLQTHRKNCRPKGRKRRTFKQIMREVENKIEEDESDYIACPICNIQSHKLDIKDHMASEHTRPDTNFTCDTCNKTFKSKLTIKEHIKLVHQAVEGSVTCELCGQAFSSTKYLKNHKRNVHPSGNKVHECNVCGKQFKSHLSVQQHRKYVHGSPAPARCKLCDRSFKARASLRHHLKHAHDNVPDK